MKHLLSLIVAILSLSAMAISQTSPYAGQEQHDIKALSPKEIEDYFNGAGMGFAKAAELNSYPGPKHVLELGEKLQLTGEQTKKTKELFQTMKQEAVRLGKAIVHQEKMLDKLFADKTIETRALQEQTGQIAKLQGELRAVHLSAHLAMKKLLTTEQIRQYDELRGYSKGNSSHDKSMHNH